MKNMFKKSLVAVAIASTSMAATAADVEVSGGSFVAFNGAPSTAGTVSNEWLSVNTSLFAGGLGGNTPAQNAVSTGNGLDSLRLSFTLGAQYSLDDRIFVTFSGDSLDVDSLPNSEVGTKSSLTEPDIITIGRIGHEIVDGNTVVEYRVTNVSEGANTNEAVITFGDDGDGPIAFDAGKVRAAGGVSVSYEAYYKNGGAQFDQAGTGETDSNVLYLVAGNELDGGYSGNLTARIDTFEGAAATNGTSVASRENFVADSGLGRANEVTYTAAAPPADGNVNSDEYGSTVATTAATVTASTVDNDFLFSPSRINRYSDWDVQLAPESINVSGKMSADYSWFLATSPTTGDTVPRGGNTVGMGDVWEASTSTDTTGREVSGCSVTSAQADLITPNELFFTCVDGTDFNFLIGAGDIAGSGTKLPRTDFNLEATMVYSGDKGKGSKVLTNHSGTWTNDGTSVFIPYMPYGADAGISQLLFVSNTGPESRYVAVDVYSRGDQFTGAVPLNLQIMANPGITKITGQVEDALEEAGLLTGGVDVFSLELIISGNDDEIEVYSGYNVNQDRNFVTNSSNRRVDRDEVRTDYTDGSTSN